MWTPWRSASPWTSDLDLGYLFTEIHTKGLQMTVGTYVDRGMLAWHSRGQYLQ